jgi:ATP-dependent DNA helicase RecQ
MGPAPDRAAEDLLSTVSEDCFLLRRDEAADINVCECRRRFLRLQLDQVDLGFAGRLPDQHVSLRAIGEMKAGDPIHLRREGSRWELVDSQGRTVGRLAKRFAPPEGMSFLRGEVLALVERRAEDSREEYRSMLRRSGWEVVVPELVFEPDGS